MTGRLPDPGVSVCRTCEKPYTRKTRTQKDCAACSNKMNRSPKLLERQIQQTCSDFLQLDGWRRLRMDLPHLRGLGVQEKGMADDLYLRYIHVLTGAPGWDDPCGVFTTERTIRPVLRTKVECLWVEWKRRTGKAMAHQMAWHQAERALGAMTLIAGIDFVASIEGFQDWYRASRLARKVR
jgi:hypothetical protein